MATPYRLVATVELVTNGYSLQRLVAKGEISCSNWLLCTQVFDGRAG